MHNVNKDRASNNFRFWPDPKWHGFTIIETLVALGILAVVALMIIPSWGQYIKKKELSAASEAIYATLRLAHSESTQENRSITAAFVKDTAGTDWCLALSDAVSDAGICNCKTGVCTIGGVRRVIDDADYNNISLALMGLTNGTYVTFDRVRGVASNSGVITLSNGPYSIVLTINRLGFVSMCSDTVMGYSLCS